MKKLYGVGLDNGFYGLGTDEEIQGICKDWNTTVYTKVLAEYDDVEFYLCAGVEIEEGVYQIKDGVVEVCGEEEDYEIVFIKNHFTTANKAII